MSYRNLGQILAPPPPGAGPTLSPTLTATPKTSTLSPPTITLSPLKTSTPSTIYSAPLVVQPAASIRTPAPVVTASPIPSNVSANIRFILESALKYKPTSPGQFVAVVIAGALRRLPADYQQKLRTTMTAVALRVATSKDVPAMARELAVLSMDPKIDYYLRIEANVQAQALAAAAPAPTIPKISLAPRPTAPPAPTSPKLTLPSPKPAPMPTPDSSFSPPTTYPESTAPETWAPQPSYMPGDGIAPMDSSASSTMPTVDTSLSPADYFAIPPDSGLLPPEAAPAIPTGPATTEEPWHKKVPVWAWIGGGAVAVGGIVLVVSRKKKPVTPNRRRRR